MEIVEQIGFFDEPGQTLPTCNPCASAPCPVCGEANGESVFYRSVMPLSGVRSYFFAYHKGCAGDPKINQFEQDVMDEVFAWDDAAKVDAADTPFLQEQSAPTDGE